MPKLSNKFLRRRTEERETHLFCSVCRDVERRHPDLTEREVADIYGVAYRTWQRWCGGKGAPRPKQAAAFAAAARLNSEYVLGAATRTLAYLKGVPAESGEESRTPAEGGGGWPARLG